MDENLVRKYFGEDVVIKSGWTGKTRIIAKYGEVEYSSDKGFINLIGGSEMYRRVVLLGKEMWGSVSVHGPDTHVLATMAHGESTGVEVIPIVEDSGDGCLKWLIGGAIFGLALVGSAFAMDGDAVFWTGSAITAVAMKLILPPLNRAQARAARLRGQKYRNPFPEVHGGDREASRIRAKEKGLL